MNGKILKILKDDFFRRISKNNESLTESIINKIQFYEYRITNQAHVANVDVEKTYFNLFEIISKGKSRSY